jgi:homoserine O-acetyltransferase
METNILTLDGEFIAENGIKYEKLTAGYNTFGTLNSERNNVAWIFHGLTGNSNPQDWWPGMVGSGNVFDTNRYFVVCVNMLGSCYGSGFVAKGPFKPLDVALPRFTIRDQIEFFSRVAKKLGIASVELMAGASIGGFIAQEWAISHPGFIKKLALIATSYYVSPWAAAFNEAQRLALLADQTFGTNLPNAGAAGLAAARSVAMLSYRGHKAFCSTQEGKHSNPPFLHKSTTYQRYQGEKLVKRFTPEAYMNIINAFDSFDIQSGRGSYEEVLAKITAKTLVISFTSDLLFPMEEQQKLASLIPDSVLAVIDADFGHDSFLLEGEHIGKYLKDVLHI